MTLLNHIDERRPAKPRSDAVSNALGALPQPEGQRGARDLNNDRALFDCRKAEPQCAELDSRRLRTAAMVSDDFLPDV
jgi:hypothetical protein